MTHMTTEAWARAHVVIASDPLLRPPTQADRDLVALCGGTVDDQIAGALMTRQMLLIPVEGDVRLVDADTWQAAAAAIGASYIEAVTVGRDWSMAVDEDGRMIGRPLNPRASQLYGTPRHGQPILGDVLLGREAIVDGGRDWVDTDHRAALAFLTERGAA
jgi:hypothetical protein